MKRKNDAAKFDCFMRDVKFYEWMEQHIILLFFKTVHFHWPIITILLPEAQLTGRIYFQFCVINCVYTIWNRHLLRRLKIFIARAKRWRWKKIERFKAGLVDFITVFDNCDKKWPRRRFNLRFVCFSYKREREREKKRRNFNWTAEPPYWEAMVCYSPAKWNVWIDWHQIRDCWGKVCMCCR